MNAFQQVKAIMQQPDVPEPEPYSDEDLERLYRQEPLPPNQSFQLPAEEQQFNDPNQLELL